MLSKAASCQSHPPAADALLRAEAEIKQQRMVVLSRVNGSAADPSQGRIPIQQCSNEILCKLEVCVTPVQLSRVWLQGEMLDQ